MTELKKKKQDYFLNDTHLIKDSKITTHNRYYGSLFMFYVSKITKYELIYF